LEIELLKFTDFEIINDNYNDNLFLCKVARTHTMHRKTEKLKHVGVLPQDDIFEDKTIKR